MPSTTYSYSNSDTPLITDVFPSTTISGTQLNYYATHRILNVGDGVRDMGDFIGLFVGGNLCSMFDITQGTVSYNSNNRVICNLGPNVEAGKYSIT